MKNLLKTRKEWLNICKNDYYYNAFISRPYITYKNKEAAKYFFDKIMSIWNNMEIILVEGRYSRLGCGNNLFNNTKSIERILCPARNAFEQYEEILKTVISQDKNKLILVSLGPAGKLLSFDLYKAGFWVLDIGHIDIEYEWYLAKVKEKIRIKGKYVNEVKDGDNNLEDYYDEKYENEIIKVIL